MTENQESENIPSEAQFTSVNHSDNNQSQTNTLSIIDASPPGVREILSSVINISESGMYYEPSCKFCNSSHRMDAEKLLASCDMATRQSDIEDKVIKFFSSNGEKIGSDIIRNHMYSHMNKGESELKKVEYISRLASLTGSQMTTLSQTKLALAAVMECLSSAGVITPTKGLSAAKAVEMKAGVLTKLFKTWSDIIAIQAKLTGELWDEGQMIAIPVSDFQRVFDDTLNAAKTPDERKLIVGLMDGLTTAIQK
jgi:hypothetical protein